VQTAFDRNVQMSQRLLDLVSRSISAPDGDVAPVTLLPAAASRKLTVLGFDGSGNVICSLPLTLGQTVALQQLANYGTDSGVANAYVIAVTGTTPFSLTTGTLLRFNALSANTGPSTANVAGLGVQSILSYTGGALVGGELSTTGPNWIFWNGTAWQIAFQGLSAATAAATYAPINNPQLTGTAKAADDGGTQQTLGWRDAPQNLQTVSYQLVLADRGKQVALNGSSLTLTIPANATTAFPIGTVTAIANLNASNLSIAITTDTLTKAGSTTTGSRTLAQNGLATLTKVASTSWLIAGTGLT
jgi:hypothetical protein